MVTYDNTWIHSSGVWAFANSVPYIISTMVLGDPRYQRATQIISIATNTQTGAATALQLSGGKDGAGAMAAEIAMPLVRTGNSNKALIVYDYSDSSFYPGIKSATWDIDRNSVRKGSVTKEGSLTPAAGSFERGRWNDFLDALVPVPGSASLVLGATLAAPSANSNLRLDLLGHSAAMTRSSRPEPTCSRRGAVLRDDQLGRDRRTLARRDLRRHARGRGWVGCLAYVDAGQGNLLAVPGRHRQQAVSQCRPNRHGPWGSGEGNQLGAWPNPADRRRAGRSSTLAAHRG
jgi:hypothetical protein